MSKSESQKTSRAQDERYFKERASRADIPRAIKILQRAGVGKRPIKGDELPHKKRG